MRMSFAFTIRICLLFTALMAIYVTSVESFRPSSCEVSSGLKQSRSLSVLLTHDLFLKNNGHCHASSSTSLAAFRQIKPLIRSLPSSTETTASSASSSSSSKATARAATAPVPSKRVTSKSTPAVLLSTATRNTVQYSVWLATAVKETTQNFSSSWSEYLQGAGKYVANYWWIHPSVLAIWPLVTNFALKTGDAAMPHWWPVTRMDHIVASTDAAMVIGFFLWSNIAYFLSGAYLVKKFPFVNSQQQQQQSNASDSTSLLSKVKQFTQYAPTRQTWLGLLLLLSGLISTIFHTEQALGSYAIANSLCYIDHAIAGTSTFYFFHLCNPPSKKVWTLGIAGLAALSIPLPGYAWLHSLWHCLSAAAAVLWALESFAPATGETTKMATQTLSSAVVHTPATDTDS